MPKLRPLSCPTVQSRPVFDNLLYRIQRTRAGQLSSHREGTAMTVRAIGCSIVMMFACSITGCAVLQPISDATLDSMRILKPTSAGYRDSSADEIDDWAFVGEEARGDRPKEGDPDPWWQKYVMSSRARSIERNLGIE